MNLALFIHRLFTTQDFRNDFFFLVFFFIEVTESQSKKSEVDRDLKESPIVSGGSNNGQKMNFFRFLEKSDYISVLNISQI